MNDKIYGIDLGTTNSLIGYRNKIYGDLIPSIADITNKKAGSDLRMDFNTTRSFKVDISMGITGKESILASALVLNELKNQVYQETKEVVKKVVISVPAYFSENQREATVKAASIAQLEVVRLVNEPTSAAIYYSRNINQLSLVYDLGGGTFDISVIDSRTGWFDVVETDGLILGGDDLDKTIRKHVVSKLNINQNLLSKEQFEKIKYECEKAKISIQQSRDEYKIDLNSILLREDAVYTLKPEVYENMVRIVFGPTLTKTKEIVTNVIMNQSYKIILVGGSTRDPYLVQMIEESLCKRAEEKTYDPDKIIAQGAIYVAQLCEEDTVDNYVSDVTKAVGIAMENGTVENLIPDSSKLPISAEKSFVNHIESQQLSIVICQGKSNFVKDSDIIGELVYDYGRVIPKGQGLITVTIKVDESGRITIKAKELLKKEVTLILDRGIIKNVGSN